MFKFGDLENVYYVKLFFVSGYVVIRCVNLYEVN